MTEEAKIKTKVKSKKLKKVSISEEELENLKQEAGEFKDKYIRLYAEFDNARKRMDREKADFVKYANEELIIEFLNILDDLERTVTVAKETQGEDSVFLKGIELVMSHVYDMLKKAGVQAIEAEGKLFDPNAHEVLMQEESETCEEGIVIEEFQKGYKLYEKVIRTTKVKVAKQKIN